MVGNENGKVPAFIHAVRRQVHRSPALPARRPFFTASPLVQFPLMDVVVAGARRRFAVQDYERHESSHVRRSAAVVLGERLLVCSGYADNPCRASLEYTQPITGHVACVFCLRTSRYPLDWLRTAYQMAAASPSRQL